VHIIVFFIFTQQRSAGLDGILFPALRQYLFVVRHGKLNLEKEIYKSFRTYNKIGNTIKENLQFHRMTAYSSIPINKRVGILDILRGFALLGILIANIIGNSLILPPSDPNYNVVNTIVINLVFLFTEGSFYPLFSLLFGIGFAIWMDKSMKKNAGVLRFVWRSTILFLLGCLFYIFIWDASILIRYSILSLPLLIFYRAGPKTLLIAAVAFFIVAVFHRPIWQKIESLKTPHQKERAIKQRQIIDDAWNTAEENKTFLNFSKARSLEIPSEIKNVYTFAHPMIPMIFCMFLLGVFCWRKSLFTKLDTHIKFWKKIFWVGLVIGFGGNLIVFVSLVSLPGTNYVPRSMGLRYIEIVANPFLTFFYISVFVLLLQKSMKTGNSLFTGLNATGRMAFTNYFIQFILLTILQAPYGFDLAGKFFAQYVVLVALFIFSLQILFSVYWMRRFVYGPMEWLWRSLTYLKFQNIKKERRNMLP
jgi:uncharacterized protein